ncbi:hypothetical protein SPSIL_014370 [Sporomusa silvacetica DSM 10669]|uniref:DUF4393 domain-containing protein n=1 Tax=Sporomusa silvacetica DSM 10669 TaxID=1123289 RepID=A0ABZ3IIX6_9FIRM|nr:DUF4393 domain-containing protein [Sporomusa silvacetica]OZC21500.1 hypothetical protein SPSIL_09100 [Sporomusa silvacetica DSM 10669]
MDLSEGSVIVGSILASQKFLLQFYSDLAQPSVQKVGEALGTVIEFGTSHLNYLGAKQKALLAIRLEQYKEKIQNIPSEQITSVPPELGIPVFQRLTYTKNDEIADLFLELLAKASSKKSIHLAQPRFTQIVEFLSVDEARIISFLRGKEYLPYLSLFGEAKDGTGHRYFTPKLTGIEKYLSLDFPEAVPAYLDNLISLGILEDRPGRRLSNLTQYFTLEASYKEKFGQVESEQEKYFTITKELCHFHITSFGMKFISCVTKKTSDDEERDTASTRTYSLKIAIFDERYIKRGN